MRENARHSFAVLALCLLKALTFAQQNVPHRLHFRRPPTSVQRQCPPKPSTPESPTTLPWGPPVERMCWPSSIIRLSVPATAICMSVLSARIPPPVVQQQRLSSGPS